MKWNKKNTTEEDTTNARVVHTILNNMDPKHRQGLLNSMPNKNREFVLEAELHGRNAKWEDNNR